MDKALERLLQNHKMTLSRRYFNAQKLLRKLISQGGKYDVADHPMDGVGQYISAALSFEKSGFVRPAEELLRIAWDIIAERQTISRKWMYRAMLAHKLSEIRMRENDVGQAARWMLLAHADDAVAGNKKGLSRDLLRIQFGFSPKELACLFEHAVQCRKESQSRDWCAPCSFAEEVLRRLMADQSFGVSIMAKTVSSQEFPISRIYLASLVIEQKKTGSSTAKGNSLEALAFYLTSLLPGCSPRPKMLRDDTVFENDLVVRNASSDGSMVLDILGRHFLVECKNWESRVNVEHIGYFLFRIRLTHSRFGLLFAPKGITGQSKGNAARKLLDLALHEDKTTCVIVDENALLEMMDGRTTSFLSQILENAHRIRFGRQRQ